MKKKLFYEYENTKKIKFLQPESVVYNMSTSLSLTGTIKRANIFRL